MKIYNTLSKQKEEFQPIEEGKVRMYVCGPTVYNYIHIGNARPMIVFDTFRRYMEYKGYDVNYVSNFTDVDDKIIKKAMEEAARVDMPISLHEEDPTLNEVNGVNKGVISDKMGIGGAPAISEDVMVARDVMLALETGAKVDIQHISSGRSVDLVRLAKKKGAKVYAEATPHHFTLTEEDVPNYGTMAKMNPPLRTEWDRTKIIEGLADGTIDMIATDHAPHAIEEKEREFTKAPSGIVGLETSLSLGITSLVKRGYLTMMQLLEKMTVNPARLYKFDCGTLEEGKAADIVIFAPDEVRTVESLSLIHI